MKNLFILVDYDNVDILSKKRGLKFIATGIISRLSNELDPTIKDLTIRLYGGWFQSNNYTSLAQDLVPIIQRDFPTIILDNATSRIFKVKIEMAYSLLITPLQFFYNTYRIRAFPKDIKAKDPNNLGCVDQTCPVKGVYEFITTGSCINQCCSVTSETMLYRGSQKLVDSMIAADIFFLMQNKTVPIILVSSDDDFWPAIHVVINSSSKFIHIHTKKYASISHFYKIIANSNYIEKDNWPII